MVTSKSAFSASGRLLLLAALGTAITLLTGVVYGRLTQRWGPGPDLVGAAKHLEDLPAQIGDWQLVRESPISEHVLQTLQCAGHTNRTYVNRKSGAKVDVSMIVGPSGPTSVHTPEICYSSQAYQIQDPRKPVPLIDKDGMTHSFWSLTFRSSEHAADLLRVYYAWCAGDKWMASESPRFEFAGRRLLYKLQMATHVPPNGRAEESDACQEFLAALLRSHWKIGS
jgi:hypothetical protein